MTYPVCFVGENWCYDITFSFWFCIYKKYPTPCRRCFVILMLLLLLSLLSRLCDYFGLIFDSSFSSFCRRCLSLLLVVVEYVFVAYDFRCHPWRSIVRCLEIVSIDSSWSLVSHVPVLLFPVSSYLLFLFHPVVVPFFFARCRRLALTAALSACFFADLLAPWIRENYRFFGSCPAAGNSRDCHGTFFACWWARASLFFRTDFYNDFRYCSRLLCSDAGCNTKD